MQAPPVSLAFVVVSILSLTVHVVLMGAFHIVLRRGRRERYHVGARRRGRRANVPAPALVSILKPLAGHDDDLDANLASFAHLEGLPYEILFGVASPSDPALPAARAFVANHPGVQVRIVLTDRSAAMNPKVAQLVALAHAARGDVLVTSDSNVRVAPDYLERLVAPLADPGVGIATNLFVGTGERTLGAALENLQLGATITPSVVISTRFFPVTVGKSMAMRAEDLARVGGFQAFADVLAEDVMMGRSFADAGMGIATVFAPVENRNVDCSMARTFERHVRWAKMRRSIQPWFFAFEPFFCPVVVTTLGLLAAPSRAAACLLASAMTLQTCTALAALAAARGRALSWKYAPLEVVRSYVMFGCWVASCFSRAIVWRSHSFVLSRGSVITPVRRSGVVHGTT